MKFSNSRTQRRFVEDLQNIFFSYEQAAGRFKVLKLGLAIDKRLSLIKQLERSDLGNTLPRLVPITPQVMLRTLLRRLGQCQAHFLRFLRGYSFLPRYPLFECSATQALHFFHLTSPAK